MSYTDVIFWVAGSVVTVGAAYLGACMGGKYTLKAVNETYKKNLETQERNRESMIKALLQGIYDEIETMWKIYKDRLGPQIDILKPGDAFPYYVPIVQEYFTVYNGNALLIGHIPDADLRRLIVITYTKARGLMDSFRLNNDFVQKMEYWLQLYQQTKDPIHQEHFAAALKVLIDYAEKIKKSHDDLKSSVTDLLRRLQKEGILYDNRK